MTGGIGGVLPTPKVLELARSRLIDSVPQRGLGLDGARAHIDHDIVPALNENGRQHYYGFVTGGVNPAAGYADALVTAHDQNVAVHLPDETIATDVEDAALRMICDLLALDADIESVQGDTQQQWLHRTFTTGATASNLVGLACGREYVIAKAASRIGSFSSGEHGIAKAMRLAELDEVQILTTMPHSSLRKAASIVGLGRDCIKEVGRDKFPHIIDVEKLAAAMRRPRTASIVAVSCAEVNAGLFATDGSSMGAIRRLCDVHGGWLHVDAAFGLLARILPDKAEYQKLKAGVAMLGLADSITGDAHKLLNVPYDCGIFLSRHLNIATEVFQNPNAAYLNAPAPGSNDVHRFIPSPLNIGIENSRRFRALPVYTSLVAYGRDWYRDMLERQIRLARGIAKFLADSSGFVLLPSRPGEPLTEVIDQIYIVVLFRALDDGLNVDLTKRINATRKIHVSGTQWGSKPATRFAIANWEVDVESDLHLVKGVLSDVVQ